MSLENSKQQPSGIGYLDITDAQKLEAWLAEKIQKPFRGYGDKKDINGNKLGIEEQIEASREQLRLVAYGFPKLGFSIQETTSLIEEIAVSLEEDS